MKAGYKKQILMGKSGIDGKITIDQWRAVRVFERQNKNA
jgi:hypothetical protein